MIDNIAVLFAWGGSLFAAFLLGVVAGIYLVSANETTCFDRQGNKLPKKCKDV